MAPMKRAEVLFLLAVVAILGGTFLFDEKLPTAARTEASIAPGSFVSTGWYCPSPGDVESQMSTTNLGDEPVHLRRWGIGGSRASDFNETDLAAKLRSTLSVRDFGLPTPIGLSETFGSATTSDLLVLSSGNGVAASRCTVQPWDRWYFANGSTQRGRDDVLLVANPFEEEAVIKVRLLLPDSDIVPARLRDIVVPELSEAEIDLSDYFPESPTFGLEVTATIGRVVVSRYSKSSGRDGAKGISLDVGVRQPSESWYFAGGKVPQGGAETIKIANPSDREALVQVIFQTEQGQQAIPELAELAVPAGRQISVEVGKFLQPGQSHGTTVTSSNSVPVVAERLTAVTGSDGGFESTLGVPDTAARWSISVGSSVANSDSLSIVNEDRVTATVRISLINLRGHSTPVELSAVTIEAGSRVTIDMQKYLTDPATAVVEALSGKIVVERHLKLGAPYLDFAEQPAQIFG